MTAPLKSIEGEGDVARTMRHMGRRAREAARTLALAPAAAKDAALAGMAKTIVAHADAILAANAEDVTEAKAQGATAAFLDRLALDRKRIDAMAASAASLAPAGASASVRAAARARRPISRMVRATSASPSIDFSGAVMTGNLTCAPPDCERPPDFGACARALNKAAGFARAGSGRGTPPRRSAATAS